MFCLCMEYQCHPCLGHCFSQDMISDMHNLADGNCLLVFRITKFFNDLVR